VSDKRPYIGGYYGQLLKPRFQALYREVKSRQRAVKLMDIFWPEDLQHPNGQIISSWCEEVEEGKARVPKGVQEWIRGQVEQDEQHAYREMAMEYAEAGKELAQRVKAGEKIEGGVVALKYLADGAGFVAGKRAEIAGTGGKQQQAFSIGQLSIVTGEPRRPRGQITQIKELPGGNGD